MLVLDPIFCSSLHFVPIGSLGILSDPGLQAGDPSTRTAGTAVRNSEREGPSGEMYQCGLGLHDCHPGLCLHHRKVYSSYDEEPVPHFLHLFCSDSSCNFMQKLGSHCLCHRKDDHTEMNSQFQSLSIFRRRNIF